MSENADVLVPLGVIIVYMCFSDELKDKTSRNLINETERLFRIFWVYFIVDDYSCVLDGRSWNKHDKEADGERHRGTRLRQPRISLL